jgi:hypothetical protein
MLFKDKYYTFYLSFALLVCMIPYRICSILHYDFYLKICVLIFSFLLCCSFLKSVKEFIPYLLDIRSVQAFFYHFLSFENFVCNMHPLTRWIFLLSLGFNLGAWPSYAEDPTFFYFSFLFFFGFYNRLKMIFLDPEFAGSIYKSLVKSANDTLTWDNIIENMSSICLSFFGRPVCNQLGRQAGKRQFPQITKRYMFSRLFQGAKSNPEAVGLATAFGASVGFVVSEHNQNTRNAANVAEAKRANDLKEVELGLKTQDEYKSSYLSQGHSVNCCSEEVFSHNILKWFNTIFFV